MEAYLNISGKRGPIEPVKIKKLPLDSFYRIAKNYPPEKHVILNFRTSANTPKWLESIKKRGFAGKAIYAIILFFIVI